MLNRIAWFLAIVAAGAASAAPRQVPDQTLAARVDRYVAPLVDAHLLSGVVLVTRGAKTLVARAYGKANWELDVPVTVDTRFRLASVTKTFTAAGIVLLAERHKLKLDDPLSKYLPDYPNADKIQIRHLLLHQSGIPNPDARTCSDATLDDVIAELAKKTPWFAPGTASGYSNGGYAILAKVTEVVSDKPWETFLGEEIFKPLALTATGRDTAEMLVPRRAEGYVPGPSSFGVMNARCPSGQAAYGSGALLSSAGDLAKWGRAVRNETLFKRTALEHPYGWGVRKWHDRDVITQSGFINGSASFLADYLADDVTIVVLSNVQSGMLEDVGKGVAALLFGLDAPPLKAPPQAAASTSAQRQTWLGRYKNPQIGTFALTERNGSLYQRWEGAEDGSYVRLTGDTTAFNLQESGAMERRATGIAVTWGDAKANEFTKE
jgi:CubicO group peptidase (beta-lactamase class C family)